MIDPEHQAKGIGEKFTKAIVNHFEAPTLSAYTRNPALLKMLSAVGTVFPLHNNPQLRCLALSLDNATEVDGDHAVYHLGRYGAEGLYGKSDPAKRINGIQDKPLAEIFPCLEDPSNALVVTVHSGKDACV